MSNEEVIQYGDSYLKDLKNACCKVEDKHIEFVDKSIEALKFQQEYQDRVQKCIERIGKATTICPIGTIVNFGLVNRGKILDIIKEELKLKN